MAFRKKAGLILKYEPDILIIPECEALEMITFDESVPIPTSKFWYGGKNHNKGLGIFTFSDYKVKLLKAHNPDLKTILPLRVQGKINFNLIAIWANNPSDPNYRYIGQVWKAVNYYQKLLSKPSILIGDFNSNTIWDKPKRAYNHSSVVDFLQKKNIHSAYHAFFNQKQGKERHSTHYWHKDKDRNFHIDYCFASASFIDNLKNVEVGTYRKWIDYSDHTPLMITFNLDKLT